MKQTVKWHLECIKNWDKSVENKKKELNRLTEEIESDTKSLIFYNNQIVRAQLEGIDAFDRNRYGVKRKQRTV